MAISFCIAARCQQHGVRELLSADRDVSRFAQVTVQNPLVLKREAGLT